MKIYKNNVCITMDLNEFHDILESDMFDELLLMIMELDDDSPSAIETVYGDDYEFASHQVYQVDDMDSFMELLKEALDDDGVQYFYGHDMNGDPVGYEGESWWIEEVVEEPKAKNTSKGKKTKKEDAKVRRILDKYKDIS